MIGALLTGAMLALMLGLACFMREMHLATNTRIRTPGDDPLLAPTELADRAVTALPAFRSRRFEPLYRRSTGSVVSIAGPVASPSVSGAGGSR